MIPLQEQEEWLSDYVQFGTPPLSRRGVRLIGGFDFRRGPFGLSFHEQDRTADDEHLAAFYGREAYEKESMQAACDNRNAFTRPLYRSTDAFVPDKLALDLFAREPAVVPQLAHGGMQRRHDSVDDQRRLRPRPS